MSVREISNSSARRFSGAYLSVTTPGILHACPHSTITRTKCSPVYTVLVNASVHRYNLSIICLDVCDTCTNCTAIRIAGENHNIFRTISNFLFFPATYLKYKASSYTAWPLLKINAFHRLSYLMTLFSSLFSSFSLSLSFSAFSVGPSSLQWT